MKLRIVTILLFSALMLSSRTGISTDAHQKKNSVKLCQIPIPRDLQDAQFVVTYRFDTDKSGKPTNIRKIKNDFLQDQPFIDCISTWLLRSTSGQVVADFFAKPTEGGWTEIHLSGTGFDQSFPYHPSAKK